MSRLEIVYQLVCFVIPAAAFFASAYFFTTKWAEVQREKMKMAALAKPKDQHQIIAGKTTTTRDVFFPMQVDAVQRLVLFLERIAPNNLIMRLNNPGLPARAFQQLLLENIRSEYEHNLAQQIFISPDAWNLVKSSKEDLIKIINMSATNLPPTATCLDLSRAIFEITAQLKSQPTDRAILFIKSELQQSLNSN